VRFIPAYGAAISSQFGKLVVYTSQLGADGAGGATDEIGPWSEFSPKVRQVHEAVASDIIPAKIPS
jgi:hypothetical protein